MRIGLVNFHRAYNCGAMLQAWALKTVIASLGHSVTFPSCNHVGMVARFRHHRLLRSFRRPWLTVADLCAKLWNDVTSIGVEDLKRWKYNSFRRKYLPEVKTTLTELRRHYDALVFGSDQIWNIKRSVSRDVDESGYFLAESVASDIPKIGYAVSIGEEGVSGEENARIIGAARRMDKLSMREEEACVGLLAKDGSSAEWVLDPTLLLTSREYNMIATPRRIVSEKYIVVYVAAVKSPFVDAVVSSVRKKSGLRVIELLVYQYGLVGVGADEKIAFGPSDFLALIRDSEAVVSVSFHGTAFAIIYEKPFVSVLDGDWTIESRQAALLRRLECPERMVIENRTDTDIIAQLSTPIGEIVRCRLDAMRVDSKEWLEKALACAETKSNG